MSEPVPIPVSALTSERAPSPQSAEGSKRRLLAAISSALIPGSGQMILGHYRKAAILLGVFAVLLLCFWPIRLLRSYPGFLSLYCCWIALYLYASWDTHLGGRLAISTRPSKWWLLIILAGTCLTLSIIGAAVTRGAGFRSFSTPSTSMENTIAQGDRFVVDTKCYRRRNPMWPDVIVLLRNGTFYVKRIIAVGGHSVEGKDGVVYVDQRPLDEPYARHAGQPPTWMNDFAPVELPPGQFFVMGDNRDVSLDTRSSEFGFVANGEIIGKALYIFGSDRTGKGIR
jgi:signal peptidase I